MNFHTIESFEGLFPLESCILDIIGYIFFLFSSSRKTHPGPVISLTDCPVDPNKVNDWVSITLVHKIGSLL